MLCVSIAILKVPVAHHLRFYRCPQPEFFQDDLFPNTRVLDAPSLSLNEWQSGKNPTLSYVSLKPANMTARMCCAAPPRCGFVVLVFLGVSQVMTLDLCAVSQAPKEQPKESKFVKYNPAVQESPDQRKEKV